MSVGWTILLIAAAWIALVAVIRLVIIPWLAHAPRGEAISGLNWRIVRLYCRVVHRVRFVGFEQMREQVHVGPMVVVSNHTGAIDPLLIQAGCRFYIRWMMASEMMAPGLNFIWKLEKPIPVDRDGRDTGAAREGIRHVQAGGALGIFPEGRIVWPPEQIRPFYLGVGLIVARVKAPVLLVWITGTPRSRSMSQSIFTPSRARVEFLELIDFKGERDAHIITQQLRERIAKVSGWPLNDESQPNDDEEDQPKPIDGTSFDGDDDRA
jgi:1-acyl-sn-glycerol-3-phosphate acyltransferase